MHDGDESDITIYPNPATDEVTVSITEDTEVSVVDMIGRVLKKVTIGKYQNRVNLSEIPEGMFIFVVGDQRYKVLTE
jgi:hypothetical protein